MYCTDLVALTEAKNIIEGEEFDNVIGVDDGKSLFKVIIENKSLEIILWQGTLTII